MAEQLTREEAVARGLTMDRSRAQGLGFNTLSLLGYYWSPAGRMVRVRDLVEQAVARTVEYPAGETPFFQRVRAFTTEVSVRNISTLEAVRALIAAGHRPVALNFASATGAGGGWLSGSRAQEESLARSSGLFACLEGRAMYVHHRRQNDPIYTDWAIYSPDVPVFRTDGGEFLEEPYLCSFITCAAPNASVMQEPAWPSIFTAMEHRIAKVLTIGAAHGHTAIVVGAWGCGAFGLPADQISRLFAAALRGPFRGVYRRVTFAITDWSEEQRFIGPFAEVLG